MQKENIAQILDKVASDICNDFCKYAKSIDDDCECEWIRQGNDCPLDRLV